MDFKDYQLKINPELDTIPEDQLMSTLTERLSVAANKLNSDPENYFSELKEIFWCLAQICYYLNVEVFSILDL
jgi:hypothetical protein